ncbi:MAG: hypothetical protein SNJ81_11840 [Cyanobacteriota bacterium]
MPLSMGDVTVAVSGGVNEEAVGEEACEGLPVGAIAPREVGGAAGSALQSEEIASSKRADTRQASQNNNRKPDGRTNLKN